MAVRRLELIDFRCFEELTVTFDPRVTVIRGPNGTGKTSLLEAVGFLATKRSFRGASRDVLVRQGAERAVLRADVERPDRSVVIEAEIPLNAKLRLQANRQPVHRATDLSQLHRVSVFSPQDLDLLKGSPAHRREFLDSQLRTADLKTEAALNEMERVLRQRSALLRQMALRRNRRTEGDGSSSAGHEGISFSAETESSLDVWDERLDLAGTEVAYARERLVDAMVAPVQTAYRHLSGSTSCIRLSYCRSWEGDLKQALRERRAEDIRIQATGCGPHRDELVIALDGMPARTHASQGEQRCIALALRLSCHELASTTGAEPPVLLLDDVFSELDPTRAQLLAERLPEGQVVVATAVGPPSPLKGTELDTQELCREPQRQERRGSVPGPGSAD